MGFPIYFDDDIFYRWIFYFLALKCLCVVSCNARLLLDQEIIYNILVYIESCVLICPSSATSVSLSFYLSRCVPVFVCVCAWSCVQTQPWNKRTELWYNSAPARVLIAYMNVNGTNKEKREVNLISIECQYRRLSVWQPKELSCQGGHRQPGGFSTHPICRTSTADID